MKRFVLLAFVCLFAAAGANAKSIVFNLANGTKVYYLLGDATNPMMRFVDGKVVVDADTYTLSEIKSFYVSETDDPTSIADTQNGTATTYSANTLVIATADNDGVKVFDMKGRMVEANVTHDGDRMMVDLNSLALGTYVVNTGGSSFKVMKK